MQIRKSTADFQRNETSHTILLFSSPNGAFALSFGKAVKTIRSGRPDGVCLLPSLEMDLRGADQGALRSEVCEGPHSRTWTEHPETGQIQGQDGPALQVPSQRQPQGDRVLGRPRSCRERPLDALMQFSALFWVFTAPGPDAYLCITDARPAPGRSFHLTGPSLGLFICRKKVG